jgi:hypothetical protein
MVQVAIFAPTTALENVSVDFKDVGNLRCTHTQRIYALGHVRARTIPCTHPSMPFGSLLLYLLPLFPPLTLSPSLTRPPSLVQRASTASRPLASTTSIDPLRHRQSPCPRAQWPTFSSASHQKPAMQRCSGRQGKMQRCAGRKGGRSR